MFHLSSLNIPLIGEKFLRTIELVLVLNHKNYLIDIFKNISYHNDELSNYTFIFLYSFALPYTDFW